MKIFCLNILNVFTFNEILNKQKANDKHTAYSRSKCTSESNVVTRQIHMHTLTNTHTHAHHTHSHTHSQTIQKPQEGKSGVKESARGNIKSWTKKCMHSRCNSLFLLLAAPFHISLQYVQFAFTHIYCFQHLINQIISVLTFIFTIFRGMDAVPTETTTIVCLLTPYCFSVYIDISIDRKNLSM